MPQLSNISRKPADVTADEHHGAWLATVAARLLNDCDFVVAGERYRFAELEAYYYGKEHPDLFAHRESVQLEDGRWYFHRTRGEYRGGSFKGLDLALGDGTSYFGLLIRTIVAPGGTLLVGPSLTVDHLLAQTKAASVAVLDSLIGTRSIWDTSSPLHIVAAEKPRDAPVYATSRVGLSLKKAKGKADAPRFVCRPYRFLTEPQLIAKGRPHLILALHRAGHSPDDIRAITGVARKTIDGYIAHFTIGTQAEGFDAYIGKDLSTAELCQLIGTWHARFSRSAGASERETSTFAGARAPTDD